jgi:hypothetical protein
MAGSAAQLFWAFSAASTARSTSSTVQAGNSEITSSVAGFTTYNILDDDTNSPSISIS